MKTNSASSEDANLDEIVENIKKTSAYYQEIMQIMLSKKSPDLTFGVIDSKKNMAIASNIATKLIYSPEIFAENNARYINQFQNLLLKTYNKYSDKSSFEQSANSQNTENDIKDNRFKDKAWSENAYFDFIKQLYFLNKEWVEDGIKALSLDPEQQEYADFLTNQLMDAVSPTNFAFSNPEVIKTSLDSKFANIVSGLENLLNDLKNSSDFLNITTNNNSKFKLGENLAATKGKVIYQNDLMELICYEPKKEVYETPIFLVPPCINKYYILDLSPKNSLVKWLVDNNFLVFLVSWKNPGKELSHISFEDYVKLGIFDNIAFLEKNGIKKVNALGYCIGGTLLSFALSVMGKSSKNPINSASFLTSLLDFAKPGNIKAFINEQALEFIQNEIEKVGYLDGRYISNSFGLIRANDLIWSFFVNNYLLGKSPAAFDILYWNSDSTNLPANMFLYYIKNMYVENNLIKPGFLEMDGKKIDLSNIKVDSFSLAAKKDHIALWDAVFDGYGHLSGNKTFCLTDAGHVAGVVNPAENSRYNHRIAKMNSKSAAQWMNAAKPVSGSWWNSWKEWLILRSGKMGLEQNYSSLKALRPAPGEYVKQ